MVAKGHTKLFCSIVDVVARISINIQEVLAVLFSYSALQPRLAPSCYITGVHHHADHVAKWDFSRVRLTKIPGRTGASSHSRKEKKVSATQKLCGSTKDTPVRLISWSKPIRDSEGRTPPLIGRGPDIPVCVCAR